MKVLTDFRAILPVVAGLLVLGASATAWSDGCIQGTDGTAGPIVFAKGKQSCDTIKGYVGCSIDKGVGSCDIKDPSDPTNVITTVTSSIGTDGALSWSSSGPGKVFAAGLNGIQSGNACVYFYTEGEGVSQSGIGYNTATSDATPTFTNLQESFFCTDLSAQVVTTEPDLKPCKTVDPNSENPIDLIDSVNCGALKDGTIVSVWTPTYDSASGEVTGQDLQQCVCNDSDLVTGKVYPCNVSGVDDGDPDTLETCFLKENGDVQMPTLLQFYPDAKSCKTSLGTVSCSCIDNPFTACNECTGGC